MLPVWWRQALKEVEWGLIEASCPWVPAPGSLDRKVLVPEALSSLVIGATITTHIDRLSPPWQVLWEEVV